MNISLIVVILIIIIIIVVVVIYFLKGFKAYSPPPPNILEMQKTFETSAPWVVFQRDSNNNLIPDGSGGFKITNESTKLIFPSISELCKVYTFKPTGQYVPGFPLIRNLSNCTVGNINCVAVPSYAPNVCVDEDQMCVQLLEHDCLGDPGLILRTSGKCIKSDGSLANQYDSEQFWTDVFGKGTGVVDTKSVCNGNIGLIAFGVNFTIGAPDPLLNARCLAVSNFTYDPNLTSNNLTSHTFSSQSCNMTTLDNIGLSSQIFRLERAKFEKGKYIIDDSGSYLRITHRATGYHVGPSFTGNDITQPIINAILKLSPPLSKLPLPKNSLVDGFWWYMLPALSDPNYIPGTSTVFLNSFQYLAYLPDPSVIPSSDIKDIWPYIVDVNTLLPTGNVLILGSFTSFFSNFFRMEKFSLYDSLDISSTIYPYNVAFRNQAQYLNYSTIQIMLKSLSSYAFV